MYSIAAGEAATVAAAVTLVTNVTVAIGTTDSSAAAADTQKKWE